MKAVKKILAIMALTSLLRPFLLRAQESGIQINNLEVADSSHLEQEFMADAVMAGSQSGNTVIIVVAALVVLAIAGLVIWKKKKLVFK
jgi:LPXTG-motif cell wall-anchored protein